MSLTAYIRYDSTGRLVPGGPIVVGDKPDVGNWQSVTQGTNVTLSGKLRAFIKLDRYNKPIASTLFFGKKRPATGKWLEVDATFAGSGGSSTTTTTTTGIPGTTTSTTTGPIVNSVKMLTADYYTTAAIYLRDVNQKYYLLNGANGFTLYYLGTLGVGTTLYFNSNLTDPAGVWSNLYLIETTATQGNPYAEPTDRIFTIDSNGTLTSIVSTIAQVSYTQWQTDKRVGSVNGLCSDLYPSGFLAAPQTFIYDVGTQIYSGGYSGGVWNTFTETYMSDDTYRYTTNGTGLLISKELCSSITTTTTTTATPIYVVGQQALGGTVAYILQPGDPGYDVNVQHGFVATVNDTSGGSAWGCNGSSISNANGTAIGTGVTNTNSIVSQCGENGAAMICSNLTEGGYSDWYLPSNDELTKLDQNKTAIGGFTNDWYWSSTEESSLNAYSYLFGSSFLTSSAKWAPYRVRAIRSF